MNTFSHSLMLELVFGEASANSEYETTPLGFYFETFPGNIRHLLMSKHLQGCLSLLHLNKSLTSTSFHLVNISFSISQKFCNFRNQMEFLQRQFKLWELSKLWKCFHNHFLTVADVLWNDNRACCGLPVTVKVSGQINRNRFSDFFHTDTLQRAPTQKPDQRGYWRRPEGL